MAGTARASDPLRRLPPRWPRGAGRAGGVPWGRLEAIVDSDVARDAEAAQAVDLGVHGPAGAGVQLRWWPRRRGEGGQGTGRYGLQELGRYGLQGTGRYGLQGTGRAGVSAAGDGSLWTRRGQATEETAGGAETRRYTRWRRGGYRRRQMVEADDACWGWTDECPGQDHIACPRRVRAWRLGRDPAKGGPGTRQPGTRRKGGT